MAFNAAATATLSGIKFGNHNGPGQRYDLFGLGIL